MSSSLKPDPNTLIRELLQPPPLTPPQPLHLLMIDPPLTFDRGHQQGVDTAGQSATPEHLRVVDLRGLCSVSQ